MVINKHRCAQDMARYVSDSWLKENRETQKRMNMVNKFVNTLFKMFTELEEADIRKMV